MENLSTKQLVRLEGNLQNLMNIAYNPEFSSNFGQMSPTLSEEQTKKLNWFIQKAQKDKEEYQEVSKQSIFASIPLISSFFEKPKDLQEMYQKTAQKLADIEVMASGNSYKS